MKCVEQDGFANILFNPYLQTLRRMIHVSTVTVAQELVDSNAMARSR